jgi:quercetin dioxygenase-like cupin family protein
VKHARLAVLLLVSAAPLGAQQQPAAHPTLFSGTTVEWKDGPASLPRGAQMALLEGDPTQAGPFTMRLRFPDGFQIPPHWHTQMEHATVLAGTIHLGMGERFDRAATRPLPAGSFGFWPAGTRHFAWAEGETVLQLHGQGPWTVTYVDPADDPRNARPPRP